MVTVTVTITPFTFVFWTVFVCYTIYCTIMSTSSVGIYCFLGIFLFFTYFLLFYIYHITSPSPLDNTPSSIPSTLLSLYCFPQISYLVRPSMLYHVDRRDTMVSNYTLLCISYCSFSVSCIQSSICTTSPLHLALA
jgi:hypothetical protein